MSAVCLCCGRVCWFVLVCSVCGVRVLLVLVCDGVAACMCVLLCGVIANCGGG